jgi:CheY-like chemotaxis protein
LLHLISDVLDYSKLDAGKIQLDWSPFSLRTAIEQTLLVVAERAQAKGLELTGFTDFRLPDKLVGDPDRIHQILLNLLSNSIKFTERGSVSVRALPATGHPTDQQYCWVKLSVKDTGIGIPEHQQATLFEPFMQADSSTTRKYGGTGLGLALCQQLVTAMSGKIEIKSVPSEGSEFILTIPFKRTTEYSDNKAASEPFRHQNVLVIEENRDSARLLHTLLEHWGATPYVLSRPENTLKILSRGEFNAIIINQHLKDEEGLALARRIRESSTTFNSLPIILMINLVEKHLFERVPLQSTLVLTKPIESGLLFHELCKLLIPSSAPDIERMLESSTPLQWQPEQYLKVLVAEDDLVNQEIASMMLRELGCSTDIARNGLEALEAVQRRDYDLIFMDCQMPEMDGFQATRQLRQRGFAAPIIALTANALPEDREECLAAGMNDYLTKPIRTKTLATLLERWSRTGTPDATHRYLTAEPKAEVTSYKAEVIQEKTPSIDVIWPQQMAGIDLPNAMEMMGGKLARYQKLLKLALDQHCHTPIKIRHAIENHQHTKARRLAHSLKGVAANIGANGLSAVAAELEMQLKEENSKKPVNPELIDRIEQHWSIIQQSILSLIR